MKRRTFLAMTAGALAAGILSAAALAGCGAGAGSSSAKNADMYLAAETAVEFGEMGVYDYEYETTAAASPAAGRAAVSGIESSSSITPPSQTGRKLIRTVNLTVETDTFNSLLKSLQEQVAGLSGYVERSDIYGSSMVYQSYQSTRRASITARIPNDRLDQFVATVEGNGNVTYKSESTSDVTLQYSDLESRKKSLTIEQERIWALLEKADTLEAVISLEERLSEIRYELESMESQLRLYDNQVDYSTVYLEIEEVSVYTPTAPASTGERIQSGFAKNLENMGNFFVNLFVLLLSSSPIWIPLLVIVGIVLLILRRRYRKGKKPAGKNTDSEPPETDA